MEQLQSDLKKFAASDPEVIAEIGSEVFALLLNRFDLIPSCV